MATLSIDSVVASIGTQTAAAESSLADFVASMDPDSSADLILLQQKLQEWSLLTNLQTTTIKTIKDSLISIVQKMQ